MREDWIEIDYKKVVNKISTNNKKLKQKEYSQKGVYPVIDQGQDLVGGYTDDESKLLDCELPVIVFGDHTKIVKLINFNFAPGADGTKVLEPKKFVLPKYLSYLTQILVFKIKDKGYARHYQHIEKQTFPIAPLPEQRAIVAKIEHLFSELDNGIANLKAAKDKLEIYRQAVLKKAFEGDWQITSVGDKFDFLGGGTPSKSNPEYWNGDIPWCSVKDVKGDFLNKTKDYITELGVDESATNIAEVGQVILITRISPGKSIIPKIRTAINQDLKIVFPKLDYRSKFTHYLFKSLERECIKRSSGTTVLGINLNSLKEIEIPDVPVQEQETIIEFIESRLSVCDNILANIEEGLEKSEALRQSILKQAFEGKLLSKEELEACRKEPDWEPAEKLLVRIEQSRNARIKKVDKLESKKVSHA